MKYTFYMLSNLINYQKSLFSKALITVMLCFSPISFALTNDFSPMEKEIRKIESELNSHIGVSILTVNSNESWSYKGNERVPLTSTFKTLLCANLLSNADKGNIALDEKVAVEKDKLITYSPVIEKHIGKSVSLYDSCSATMTTSDNTAANIVLQKIGGPITLTKFIRNIGDDITRLDRYEPELNEGKPGDLRDTTTPNAITKTLNELLFGSALSEESQNQLKQWMIDNKVSDHLLRSILPSDWIIADRSGAGGYGSRSITSVFWPENTSPFIVSIYITQTKASFEQRNEAIVKIGKAILKLHAQQQAKD